MLFSRLFKASKKHGAPLPEIAKKILDVVNSATIGWEFECPLHTDHLTALTKIKNYLDRLGIPYSTTRGEKIFSQLGLIYLDTASTGQVLEFATPELLGAANSVQGVNAIKLLLNLAEQGHDSGGPRSFVFPFIGIGYYSEDSRHRSSLGCHLNMSHELLNILQLEQIQLTDLALGCTVALAFSPIIPQLARKNLETGDNFFYLTVSDRGPDISQIVGFPASHAILKTPDIATFEKSRVGSLHANIFSPPMSELSHLCLLLTVSTAMASASNKLNLFVDSFTKPKNYSKPPNQEMSADLVIQFINRFSLELPLYLIFGHRTPSVELALAMLNQVAEHISVVPNYGPLFQEAVRALNERDFERCLLVDSLHTALLYGHSSSDAKPSDHGNCVFIPRTSYEEVYPLYFWQSSLPFELVVEHSLQEMGNSKTGVSRGHLEFWYSSYRLYKQHLRDLGFDTERLLDERIEKFFSEKARLRLSKLHTFDGKPFSWDL